MKKFILMGALITMMSVSAVGVNAAYSDIDTESALCGAVENLRTLEIMSGYDDGEFKPDNNVTRAEMANIMFNALYDHTILSKYEAESAPFNDMDKSHWATNAISILKTDERINGYEDGSFKPDNNITYNEFAKIVITMLGYNVRVTDYPTGYLSYINEFSLFENILETDYTKPITRKGVALVLDKAVDIPRLYVVRYERDIDGMYPIYDTFNDTTIRDEIIERQYMSEDN